jgi:HK97 family phage major capsid protein
MRIKEDIIADMNAIVEAAEGRSFTDAEVSSYETLKAELKGVTNAEAIREHNVSMNTVQGTAPRTGAPKPRKEETISQAFTAYLRTGQPNADLAGLAVTNAQGEGAGSTGGYLVPTEFRAKLIDRMRAFGGIAPYVENVDTGDGRPIEWAVTLDDTSNTGEQVAEHAAPTSGADMAFDQVQLGAYSYASAGPSGDPLRVSLELLQDAAFDVEGLVSRKLGQRLARAIAPGIVRGSGVGEPLGLVTGRTPVQTAANTGPVLDDLIEWEHSVDPAYRELNNCAWAMNDSSLKVLKKLKDSHGDSLWRPADADMGTALGGGMLMGYPVRIDQSFVDMDVDDSTDLWGAFGDFREGYVKRNVRDVILIVNPWSRANNRQVEFSAWMRVDGTQQNTAAYIVLSGKS